MLDTVTLEAMRDTADASFPDTFRKVEVTGGTSRMGSQSKSESIGASFKGELSLLQGTALSNAIAIDADIRWRLDYSQRVSLAVKDRVKLGDRKFEILWRKEDDSFEVSRMAYLAER